jgi:hypothetical protein
MVPLVKRVLWGQIHVLLTVYRKASVVMERLVLLVAMVAQNVPPLQPVHLAKRSKTV